MLIYENDPPESCWFKPSKGNLISTIDMPANYEVSFDVRPLGALGDWSSLVHVTAFNDNQNGSYGRRIPGFWFGQHNTSLHVVPASIGAGNPYKNTDPLPLNEITRVRLIAFDTTVRCFINDALVLGWDEHQRESHPGAKLYAGDPWYAPSNAEIRHVEIRELECAPRELSLPAP